VVRLGLDSKDNILPDGRTIAFTTSEEGGYHHELRVSSDRKKASVIDLGQECIQVSANWKRLVRVLENSIAVYDLEAVLKAGTLDGNKIGDIPMENACPY
jgi:hypothetical protein